jgi:NTE family protein
VSLALVLGGGGITGAAWMAGLLKGMRDMGTDLTGADLIVGTSAGAVVGAVIATDRLDAFYALQTGPVDPAVERVTVLDLSKFAAAFGGVGALQMPSGEIPQPVRVRVGQLAVSADYDFSEQDRLRTMASRVGVDAWPDRRLMITAVACDDGALTIWTKDSGVSLVTAVASSCAAPFVYPPITIAGRRYMDGGIRSGTNADLAQGSDRIVVIAPLGRASIFGAALIAEVEALRARGARVAVVEPDTDALEAFGPNPLDPARRSAAAEAGHKQAATATMVLRDEVPTRKPRGVVTLAPRAAQSFSASPPSVTSPTVTSKSQVLRKETTRSTTMATTSTRANADVSDKRSSAPAPTMPR